MFSVLGMMVVGLRRGLSRAHWGRLMLSLPRERVGGHRRGLIMIQIDGLAMKQLSAALQAGRMPFLKRLSEREPSVLRTFYSGIPSTTPAVQGELFYGIKTAVPAFGFRDQESMMLSTMLNPLLCNRVQQRLELRTQQPLLDGGSAYADVYTGGAKRSLFCVAGSGGGIFTKTGWPGRGVFVLVHSFMLLRAVGLGGIELLLALSDLVRGVLKGNSFIKELTFIPARVGICVMLRELISAQVMIDAARGVPIIHANFLGYDEQSHRRGPDSAFAHWTLSGIDNSIFRIYKSAHLSAVRDYDLWIYSDHGQERVVSYQRAFGKCFKSAVIEALQTVGISQVRFVGSLAGVQLKRVLLLGGAAVLRRLGVVTKPAAMDAVSLIANGPIGHLYLPGQLGDARRKLIGEVLVGRAHIPMVLARGRWGEVDVWTSEGAFRLPRDAQVVIGAHHPLLAEVAEDVRALMHHPDSGTFVLAGYRPNQRIISFVEECGAHAGMGPDETRGFALLPSDAPVERGVQQSMRPVELREAALRFMGRLPGEVLGGCKSGRVRTSGSVRVMSYNTHGCRGLDGRVAPERIARIIAHYEPDIVGLQELDVGRMRSGGVDQAQVIGALLNMRYHFHPSYHIEEERYGSAVLSRLPLRLIKAGALPYTIGREPRGALWVEVELGRSRVIQFITTHFGLSGVERCKQAEELLGAQWIQSVHCTHPVVLCGDFNFLNSSAPYRMVAAHLSDASRAVKKEEQPKVGSYMGVAMVDYIFHSRELRVERVFVANNRLVRAASDHYPLCADLLCAG